MVWKRNVPGYLGWFLYLFALGAVVFGIASVFPLPIENESVMRIVRLGISAVYFFAFYGIYLSIRNLQKNMSGRSIPRLVDLLVIFLALGGGIALRLVAAASLIPGGDYFEMAKVSENGPLLQSVHGAVYIYLLVLRGIFRLGGNHWILGIWLQILLQTVAALLLSASVRRLAGRMAGLVSLCAILLLPYFVKEALVYSPAMLYLCIYSFGLWIITGRMRRTCLGDKDTLLWKEWMLGGACIGLITYLDLSGISIMALGVSLFWMEQGGRRGFLKKNILHFLSMVLGCLGIFGVCLLVDALWTRGSVGGIGAAWMELYTPRLGHGWFLQPEKLDFVTTGVLICLLTLGVFSFWVKEEEERFSPWIFLMVSASVPLLLGMYSSRLNGGLLLMTCLVIIGGLGLSECFADQTQNREADESEQESEAKTGIDVAQPKEAAAKGKKAKAAKVKADRAKAKAAKAKAAKATKDKGTKAKIKADRTKWAEPEVAWEEWPKAELPMTELPMTELPITELPKAEVSKPEVAETDVFEPEAIRSVADQKAEIPHDKDKEPAYARDGATGNEAKESGQKKGYPYVSDMGVEFIDNPLPLPKRHEKKSLEYSFEPEEAYMCYDLDVRDDDDYDI